MRCLIIKNTYSKFASQTSQVERFVNEFKELLVNCTVVTTAQLPLLISSTPKKDLSKTYDFALFLDKDKYYSRLLEDSGLRVFNKPLPIEICDDKMLTHIELSKASIPQPKTIPGLLCYVKDSKVDDTMIHRIEDELSYPLIVKESFGSFGKGVYLVKNRKELEKIANKLIYVPHLFQEYIKEAKGKDTRVVVIGGHAVAWMERVSDSDFRSNIELGGKGYPCILRDDVKELAEKVASVLDLDYCGIDLLMDKDGQMLVCEVNSNAFFNELEKVTGLNVARMYCEYMIKTCAKNKQILSYVIKTSINSCPTLPVRLSMPLEQDKIKSVVEYLKNFTLDCVVKKNDIVIKNILDTGVDVICSSNVLFNAERKRNGN